MQKLVNGGFLEGETFAQVINDEFGSRMTAVGKTLGPNSSLNGSEHGLTVATILAGRNGNGAKGAFSLRCKFWGIRKENSSR